MLFQLILSNIFAFKLGLMTLFASMYFATSNLLEYSAHEFLICEHSKKSRNCSKKFERSVGSIGNLFKIDYRLKHNAKNIKVLKYKLTCKRCPSFLGGQRDYKTMSMSKPKIEGKFSRVNSKF